MSQGKPLDSGLTKLRELPDGANLAQKAELCIWGGELRRLRPWETWQLCLRNPDRYVLVHPSEKKRYERIKKGLIKECKLKLGAYLAEAVENGSFEKVAADMILAGKEHENRNPFTIELSRAQLDNFDKWAVRPAMSNDELHKLAKEKRYNEQIEAIGFNDARTNAMHVLKMVLTAVHRVHAGVLLFSRRFKKSSVAVRDGRDLQFFAQMNPQAAEGPQLSKLNDHWKISITNWRVEVFEADTEPEGIIITDLKERLGRLFGDEISGSHIKNAMNDLRIKLPVGKRGRPGK